MNLFLNDFAYYKDMYFGSGESREGNRRLLNYLQSQERACDTAFVDLYLYPQYCFYRCFILTILMFFVKLQKCIERMLYIK